jgi:glutamate mutase epsilon subunit
MLRMIDLQMQKNIKWEKAVIEFPHFAKIIRSGNAEKDQMHRKDRFDSIYVDRSIRRLQSMDVEGKGEMKSVATNANHIS